MSGDHMANYKSMHLITMYALSATWFLNYSHPYFQNSNVDPCFFECLVVVAGNSPLPRTQK